MSAMHIGSMGPLKLSGELCMTGSRVCVRTILCACLCMCVLGVLVGEAIIDYQSGHADAL